MKKFKELCFIIVLVVFLSISSCTKGTTVIRGTPPVGYNEEVLAEVKDQGMIHEDLLSKSKIYDEMLQSVSTYKEISILKSGLNPTVSENENPARNKNATPNWYNYIQISGYIGPKDLVGYGPYSNCDWIRVSINWTPLGNSVTLFIYDLTNHTTLAYYTSASGSITISSNLDTSHNYEADIFNNSNSDISYTGQITLSIK